MKKLYQPILGSKLQTLLRVLEGSDDFVFLETTRSDEENRYSFLFLEPVALLTCQVGDVHTTISMSK